MEYDGAERGNEKVERGSLFFLGPVFAHEGQSDEKSKN